MNRLSSFLKKSTDKLKGMSKGRKIALVTLLIGIIAAIVTLKYTAGATKYAVLFSNMDSKDCATVYQKLVEDKVKVKLEGTTILVPEKQVDSLRMQMMSSINSSNVSQGFELLDKSKFGQTDEELQITYQRALQGEIEKSIKTFPEVAGARVSITMPEDTEFVKDTTTGKAFVTVKLQPGKQLTKDQVKAIVSLVSGSVKNIPKENVEVTDTVSLLTNNLYKNDSDTSDVSSSTDAQQKAKTQYEDALEEKALDLLETTFGKDKVKVKINADLNFDTVQKETTTYDPNHVSESEQTEKQTSTSPNSETSASPVDNNMTNNISNSAGNSTSTSEKKITNYKVSSAEDKTIKAPGQVERVTASVVLDGDSIDDATKTSVRNLIISAIGIDEKRGDIVTVEGLPFDTTYSDKAKKDADYIDKTLQNEKRIKMYKTIGAASACLIILLVLGAALKKKNKSKSNEAELQAVNAAAGEENNGDMDEENKPKIRYKPVELDVENERTHLESEIKKYASQKPEQVAEIIKSWLAEDER